MEKSKIIVLLHGNFVNNLIWDPWIDYYESKGYVVYAPARLGHEGNPSELRTHIHPDLPTSGFTENLNNITSFIDSLPEKPIVIGHSMAGLFVMKLVENGKAAAGISVNGAPPKNVLAPFSTIKTVLPSLLLFSTKKVWLGDPEWFNSAFFNTLPITEREEAYHKFVVPESKKVTWDTLTKSIAKVDFAKPHAPLLFIGAEDDQIFPSSFTKKIAGKYQHPTDVKIFEDKSHFICGEPGWQDVADYIINWYEQL